MKLKLDENLGRRWAQQLRDAGHDVHTIWDEQLSGASDPDVLAAAVDEARALVTIDLDFANPIRFPPSTTAGIAVLRLRDRTGRDDIDALISRFIQALEGSGPTGCDHPGTHLVIDNPRASAAPSPDHGTDEPTARARTPRIAHGPPGPGSGVGASVSPARLGGGIGTPSPPAMGC